MQKALFVNPEKNKKMRISIESLKKGTEVDMPMREGEDFMTKAIRYNKDNDRFELYNFDTGEVSYSYTELEQLLKHTNRIFGTDDSAVAYGYEKGGEIDKVEFLRQSDEAYKKFVEFHISKGYEEDYFDEYPTDHKDCVFEILKRDFKTQYPQYSRFIATEYADGGEISYYDIYDDATNKTYHIKAYSLEQAEGIADTIDWDEYKDGERIDVLDDIANYESESGSIYADGGKLGYEVSKQNVEEILKKRENDPEWQKRFRKKTKEDWERYIADDDYAKGGSFLDERNKYEGGEGYDRYRVVFYSDGEKTVTEHDYLSDAETDYFGYDQDLLDEHLGEVSLQGYGFGGNDYWVEIFSDRYSESLDDPPNDEDYYAKGGEIQKLDNDLTGYFEQTLEAWGIKNPNQYVKKVGKQKTTYNFKGLNEKQIGWIDHFIRVENMPYAKGGETKWGKAEVKKIRKKIEGDRGFEKLFRDTGENYDLALEMWLEDEGYQFGVESAQDSEELSELITESIFEEEREEGKYEKGGEIVIKSGKDRWLEEVFSRKKNQRNELLANQIYEEEKAKGKNVFLLVNDEIQDSYIQPKDNYSY